MTNPSCCSWCPCNWFFVLVLVLLLCGSLVSGVLNIAQVTMESVSLPGIPWMPLSAIAAGGTVWGLWLGARHHGRGEPLAVAVFGLLWVAVGFVTVPGLALVGTTIALGAAVWGALLYRRPREEDVG